MGLLIFDKDLNTFIFRCSYGEKEIPKAMRFKWDPIHKHWHEPSHARAAKLSAYAHISALKEINRRVGIREFKHPLIIKKGVKPYAHQREACQFILERDNAYYAGDPGVGKTAVAIISADTYFATVIEPAEPRFIVICPPFLVLNWQEEIRKYSSTKPCDIEIVQGLKSYISFECTWTLVPDSLLTSCHVRDQIHQAPGAFHFMIVDEGHRFKNQDAIRTRALFGHEAKRKPFAPLTAKAERVLILSGTPMPNRPIELFPVLNRLAPHTINGFSFFEYAQRYCDASRTDWGWDFSGASNVAELHENIIGSFMLRHSKEKCLDLPAKVISYRKIDLKLASQLKKKLKAVTDDDILDIIDGNPMSELGELATMRSELSAIKAEASLSYIEAALEESGKILVFAWHKKAIQIISEHFKDKVMTIVNDGSVDKATRHENVKRFQEHNKPALFIGQIATMVGITLTAAHRGIFVEVSWQPGENEQAMDRMHRIGQTEKVLIEILTSEHDLDERVMRALATKRKTINKFLTGHEPITRRTKDGKF